MFSTKNQFVVLLQAINFPLKKQSLYYMKGMSFFEYKIGFLLEQIFIRG